MTSAFSKISKEKCLEIWLCFLWAHLNRRLKRDFVRCLYTFFIFIFLFKTRYWGKMQNHMVNFSQVWHKVCLGELNSSLCKIRKSHALLQRLSLIKIYDLFASFQDVKWLNRRRQWVPWRISPLSLVLLPTVTNSVTIILESM